jgi:hypothetical protein
LDLYSYYDATIKLARYLLNGIEGPSRYLFGIVIGLDCTATLAIAPDAHYLLAVVKF